ncbi:MAG: Tad domain-containing protein [Pseudomonadota bacterium]
MTRFETSNPIAPLRTSRGWLRTRTALTNFCADEDGAMLSWGLFTTLGIFMATGLGLSMQLYEVYRTQLQNTLDRAVLAATDLDQPLEAEEVIADYVMRAGMAGALKNSDVTEGLNFRTSTADAGFDMNTIFVPGQQYWDVDATSTAFESVTDVEISLVLDISGTMRFENRLEPLEDAAVEFVQMVLEGDRAEGTTVSVVPYSGQVNPGPLLFDEMGGERLHDNSSCVYLEREEFDHTGFPDSSSTQVPHFHKWNVDWEFMDWGWCPSEHMRIRPLQNDVVALETFLRSMRLHDGTGTHNGMRYGLALLDPASESVLDVLEGTGEMPTMAYDRPRAWDATDSVKYIVLMTDGQITDQFIPKYYEFRDPDEDDEDNESGDVDDIDGIDHEKLNAEVETNNQNSSIGKDEKLTSRNENLADFYKACDAAKANDVIVFTIAFEAPEGAKTEMRNCASSINHYFDVDQLEIGAAFSSIARTINQLRLTQ